MSPDLEKVFLRACIIVFEDGSGEYIDNGLTCFTDKINLIDELKACQEPLTKLLHKVLYFLQGDTNDTNWSRRAMDEIDIMDEVNSRWKELNGQQTD